MDTFQIGMFTIRHTWLFLLISMFITYIISDAFIKRQNIVTRETYYNIMVNILIFMFLSYKFGYILFRPDIIWENPLGVLYFTGGETELILGAILSTLYLCIRLYVLGLSRWKYGRLIVYGFVTFILSYYIVQTMFSLLI